jgi:proteasome lid subunit RPN8/RPN11
MPAPVHLSDICRQQILRAARKAYPMECCGLLEGTDTAAGWRVDVVHEAPNLAGTPSRRFLIDPQVQFRLLRSLRGSERRIIGCFHSHPNGKPEPSDEDRRHARETEFLWLVVGGIGMTELGAFVCDAEESLAPLRIVSN